MTAPLDPQDMAQIILRSPNQFQAGLKAAAKVKLPSGPCTNVLVAGMGGSWMAAALVAEAGLARVPIRIHRTYGLPAHLDRATTLVIASSFSGNTAETLSAYDKAHKAGFAVVGIAAGGKLRQRCEEDRVPFVCIPADPPTMQPRSATGYGVGILVRLLARCGLAVKGAVETVEGLAPYLTKRMPSARQQGKDLARRLFGRTPVIYASHNYATVAPIWKIKFNENAKTPAFWNVLPESNHNEMTGWLNPQGRFHLVLLSDPEEDNRILDRIAAMQKVLSKAWLRKVLDDRKLRRIAEGQLLRISPIVMEEGSLATRSSRRCSSANGPATSWRFG